MAFSPNYLSFQLCLRQGGVTRAHAKKSRAAPLLA
jgi:hypothetical protein